MINFIIFINFKFCNSLIYSQSSLLRLFLSVCELVIKPFPVFKSVGHKNFFFFIDILSCDEKNFVSYLFHSRVILEIS